MHVAPDNQPVTPVYAVLLRLEAILVRRRGRLFQARHHQYGISKPVTLLLDKRVGHDHLNILPAGCSHRLHCVAARGCQSR